MAEKDYTRQLDRIIELLEQERGTASDATGAPAPERPRHSGHKGGEFMTTAREEFNRRFKGSSLQWSQVNKWLTILYKMGSEAKEGGTTEDLTWLFRTLATSLENGFAQVLKDMEK